MGINSLSEALSCEIIQFLHFYVAKLIYFLLNWARSQLWATLFLDFPSDVTFYLLP